MDGGKTLKIALSFGAAYFASLLGVFVAAVVTAGVTEHWPTSRMGGVLLVLGLVALGIYAAATAVFAAVLRALATTGMAIALLVAAFVLALVVTSIPLGLGVLVLFDR